jgi:hypothetical protein
MDELELIQNYYSQLPDDQLIQFAKADGTKISEDSLGILYDEFVKRGLDTALLDGVVETISRHKAAAADTASYNSTSFRLKREEYKTATSQNFEKINDFKKGRSF